MMMQAVVITKSEQAVDERATGPEFSGGSGRGGRRSRLPLNSLWIGFDAMQRGVIDANGS